MEGDAPYVALSCRERLNRIDRGNIRMCGLSIHELANDDLVRLFHQIFVNKLCTRMVFHPFVPSCVDSTQYLTRIFESTIYTNTSFHDGFACVHSDQFFAQIYDCIGYKNAVFLYAPLNDSADSS